ncbi:hypothetical protein NQX30_05615 [Candidatus Persebacteraceae bacterium Df01]|jgi:hypothetical protein|uniref:Uncharacterized protein n=1 Tax=Candidatus Doriopsillibacter californiensis TaxID=2970740 RepID=A0ABT7QMB3_9GAMM|nr:hypothetical protein [Candidatus Persebacteraceae bacterium Df01]
MGALSIIPSIAAVAARLQSHASTSGYDIRVGIDQLYAPLQKGIVVINGETSADAPATIGNYIQTVRVQVACVIIAPSHTIQGETITELERVAADVREALIGHVLDNAFTEVIYVGGGRPETPIDSLPFSITQELFGYTAELRRIND